MKSRGDYTGSVYKMTRALDTPFARVMWIIDDHRSLPRNTGVNVEGWRCAECDEPFVDHTADGKCLFGSTSFTFRKEAA